MELPPEDVRFMHTPLNFRNKEIRLLTIEPSSDPASPIQITIKHVDFSGHIDALARYQEKVARLAAQYYRIPQEQKKPVYDECFQGIFEFTALSYTWGPDSPAHDILVTSPDCRGWLSVRQNLYEFLKIRRDCSSAWFWIDQICINQGKNDEKTHQVNQMAEIYSVAAVEVWLGSGFEGSDELVDLIAHESILSTQDPRPKLSVNKQEMSTFVPSICCLLRIPYWSRLWVTQEIVLGMVVDIRVGLKTLPWDTFYSGWQRLYEAWRSLDHTDEYLDMLYSITRIRDIDGGRKSWYQDWASIWDLVERAECSDLRDRVFGTMGMVHPSLRILPDYSMQPQDVLLMLLPKIVESRRGGRSYCVLMALYWLEELENVESRINRRSVRHHLVKILPLDPPKFGCKIGQVWLLKCYLRYKIPEGHIARWQTRAVPLRRLWSRFKYKVKPPHPDVDRVSFADSDSL